jgi:hypothetical protein
MNDNFTKEERNLIARIESSAKWDNLFYDLSILVPSFIIIGLGKWFDSTAVIITGMVVYTVFALRVPLHQAKTLPVLKSLIKKLKEGKEGQ